MTGKFSSGKRFISLKHMTRYGSFFIPFRLHLVIMIAALLLAYNWLNKNNTLPDTAYTSILSLFVTVVLWFTGAVLLLAFVSALIPWIIFLFAKRYKRAFIQVSTALKENTFNEKQQVQISIHPVLRPAFGYIRLRLKYDDDNISSKFSLLDSSQKIHFISARLDGFYNWSLPEIKEYKVTGSIIYFEDMFQFFSFASTQFFFLP